MSATNPEVVLPTVKQMEAAADEARKRRAGDGDARRPKIAGLEVPDGCEVSPIPSDLPDAEQRAIASRWTSRKGYTLLADKAGNPVRFDVEGFTLPCLVAMRLISVGRELRRKHLARR